MPNRRITVMGATVRDLHTPAGRQVGAFGRNFGLAVVWTKYLRIWGWWDGV